MKLKFMLFALPLNIDIGKAPENFQTELVNLQCHTNLTQIFSATELQCLY